MKNYNLLKGYCSKIFLVGAGNFWFEKDGTSNDKSFFYGAFSTILFSIYFLIPVLEWMGVFFGDFPKHEHRECVSFGVSHILVVTKIFSIICNKKLIKSLNERMIRVCERVEDPSLMKKQYRVTKINLIISASLLFSSFILYSLEGLSKMLKGSHFVVIVTYYPAYDNNSVPATFTRIFFAGIQGLMTTTMYITVDGLIIIHLIMYKYKFITLRKYFEKLPEEFDRLRASGDEVMARDVFCERLVDGIKMHIEVIGLKNDFVKAFGLALTTQICGCCMISVLLLLQLALTQNIAIAILMKLVIRMVAASILLEAFVCNAGEITIQAALVPDAIFYCGWHTCPPRHRNWNIRKLVLVSLLNAQRPILIKPLKMVELTHATYLKVLKMTYSIFALIRAQNR